MQITVWVVSNEANMNANRGVGSFKTGGKIPAITMQAAARWNMLTYLLAYLVTYLLI